MKIKKIRVHGKANIHASITSMTAYSHQVMSKLIKTGTSVTY